MPGKDLERNKSQLGEWIDNHILSLATFARDIKIRIKYTYPALLSGWSTLAPYTSTPTASKMHTTTLGLEYSGPSYGAMCSILTGLWRFFWSRA